MRNRASDAAYLEAAMMSERRRYLQRGRRYAAFTDAEVHPERKTAYVRLVLLPDAGPVQREAVDDLGAEIWLRGFDLPMEAPGMKAIYYASLAKLDAIWRAMTPEDQRDAGDEVLLDKNRELGCDWTVWNKATALLDAAPSVRLGATAV